MRKKIHVAVLMGGKSAEHDVSLASGCEVVKNLNPKKYEVFPIIISKDGFRWQFVEKKQFLLNFPSQKLHTSRAKTKNLNNLDQTTFVKEYKIDVVFIAMHGPFGEDGVIQGFLELLNVSYTGSKVLASALGMDKVISKRLFAQSGLKVPSCVVLNKKDNLSVIWKKLKLPILIKPSNQGSSVGVSIVSSTKELSKALKKAFEYSNQLLIEEFLEGIEVTGSVLGNENPKALPIIEIVPKTSFFDFNAKYNEDLCDEIVPARISNSLTKKAQNVAIKAYKTIGCMGFGRVDMIIRDKDVYVLEVNTIPGLTSVSLFPKAARAAGITYSKLLDKIVNFAIP